MDGRQDPFPPALVLEHIEMETVTGEFRDVFSRHNINCACLPTVSPTVKQLTTAGWTTLYQGCVVGRPQELRWPFSPPVPSPRVGPLPASEASPFDSRNPCAQGKAGPTEASYAEAPTA